MTEHNSAKNYFDSHRINPLETTELCTSQERICSAACKVPTFFKRSHVCHPVRNECHSDHSWQLLHLSGKKHVYPPCTENKFSVISETNFNSHFFLISPLITLNWPSRQPAPKPLSNRIFSMPRRISPYLGHVFVSALKYFIQTHARMSQVYVGNSFLVARIKRRPAFQTPKRMSSLSFTTLNLKKFPRG